MSIGKICDDKCMFILTKEDLYITPQNQVILDQAKRHKIIKGSINSTTQLWDVPPLDKTINVDTQQYLLSNINSGIP